MKILFIGSSKVQQDFFVKLLQECGGNNVTVASSGENALDILDSRASFSLICSSVVLDDMSGAELCKSVRSRENLLLTPIIMLSSGGETVISECIQAGATDVFSKGKSEDLKHYVQRMSYYIDASPIPSRGNRRCLFVEDSPSTAAHIMGWLKDIPLNCDHFESAEEALDAYQTEKYDILITDVVLRGSMSGLRLARRIREDFKDTGLPILVISGFPDASRILEVYCAGANDYVAKPPNHSELIARVVHLLGSRQESK
jgi:two-component system cell cycle response regulator